MMLVLGNTIAMGVRERTFEYGILRAMGFLPRQIAFFILGLDAEPALQAIYVPPDLRNIRLGSSLFVNMAAMMHVEDIDHVSMVTWGQNSRFFERLGARSVDGRPDMNGAQKMTFKPGDLTRPPGWFEPHVSKVSD